MEGKKIAFIVVAIATIGGIAYYLNKRNKQLGGLMSEVTPENKSSTMSTLSKEAKIKLAREVAVKAQYAPNEVATTFQGSKYD